MRRVALASFGVATFIIGFAVLSKVNKPTQEIIAAVQLPSPAILPQALRPSYTVNERVEQYGEAVTARLTPAFSAAGVNYPPHEIAYIAFKDQRQLQVYARNAADQPWRYVKQYAVLAASGKLGPKLAEGDQQVPEGIYKAELLNANSRFHLSIRLNYPNDFDRSMAKRDKRAKLGGDIMIHGNAVSIGCLAMGDQAAEDLFILAAQVSKERTRIVVSPTDFRSAQAVRPSNSSTWTPQLYDALRGELQQYPRPK